MQCLKMPTRICPTFFVKVHMTFVDGGRYFTLHNGIDILQQIREIRVYKR